MDLSDLFAQCHAYSAEQSTIDLLPPKQAAVYGFYDLLRANESTLIDSIDRLKTAHGRTLRLELDDLPIHYRLRLRGNPDRFKGESRTLCDALTVQDKPEFAHKLMFLSFLNEPLYIGKTEDIRTRLRAHHDKDFLFKMKDKHRRSPDEFLLFAFFCREDFVRPLEGILLQIVNPPFNDQKM